MCAEDVPFYDDSSIDFEAIDDKPVHVVFLLLAEAGKPGETLQVLAEFAQTFGDKELYRKLLSAETPRQVMDLLETSEGESA